MPACMCIVHQSRSIDTGNTMHDNPLQTMTIDSVTYIKSGILQKGIRSGRGLVVTHMHRCCKHAGAACANAATVSTCVAHGYNIPFTDGSTPVIRSSSKYHCLHEADHI